MAGFLRIGARRAALGLMIAGAALSAVASADSAKTPPTILLADAADDMTADAGRFALQTDAIKAARAWTSGDFQMAAYGVGGCGDAGGADAKADLFGRPAPGGRRDIAGALEFAAEKFDSGTAPKRIVAIVGGPNQCLAALCARASRLKDRSPGVVVDVIGFGLSNAAARRVDCVAANTGGRFIRAEENGLARALALAFGTASAAPPAEATNDGVLAAKAAALGDAPPTVEIPVDMTGPEISFPHGLRLSVALAEGAAPIESGVSFELLRRTPEQGLQLAARTSRVGTPLFAVPPGRYVARIALGEVTRELAVSVPEFGIVNRRIVLNAGRLLLSAQLAGRAAATDAAFTIERLDAPGAPIALSGRGQPLATVAAGRYRVVARVGVAEAEAEFEVGAGETASAAVAVPTGFLRIAADADVVAVRVMRNGEVVAIGPGLHRLGPGVYQVAGFNNGGAAESTVEVADGGLASVVLRGAADGRLLVAQRQEDDATR